MTVALLARSAAVSNRSVAAEKLCEGTRAKPGLRNQNQTPRQIYFATKKTPTMRDGATSNEIETPHSTKQQA